MRHVDDSVRLLTLLKVGRDPVGEKRAAQTPRVILDGLEQPSRPELRS
jgi:hypothetical protein